MATNTEDGDTESMTAREKKKEEEKEVSRYHSNVKFIGVFKE